MRYVICILSLLVTVVLFSQRPSLYYKTKIFPDPRPSDMEDLYELDTLVYGYWTLRVDSLVLYPTMVGYKIQDCPKDYYDWPPVYVVVEKARLYFVNNVSSEYYEDPYVRVFVSRRQ